MDTPYSLSTLDEVVSTQDLARERARPERPAVVVAHRQTGGRGRGGSIWATAPRAVAVSVGFYPVWEASRWSLIPLVAGVAARRALEDRISLKWPNDVVVGDHKVGGILVEAAGGMVVAGMGLNLFWPEPVARAAGLYSEDPGREEGPRLATRWAEQVLALTASGVDEWPRQEYVEACVTLGSEITWEPHGRGRAIDIGPDGSLEVVTAEGHRRLLSSGEVHHVRPA